MSALKSLARHARNNSLASVLTTIAGLVSFPVLTRALAIEDYGVMNLIASALTLAVGLGKLGMQQAATRFYGDVRAERLPGVTLASFLPTVIYGMGLMGLVAMGVWLLASLVVPHLFATDGRVGALMQITAVLVFVRVLQSGIQNLLWAQERTGTLAMITVIHRYVSLGLVLGAVLLIAPTLWSFYGATALSEAGLLTVLLVWTVRSGPPMQVRAFSSALFRQMIVFAVPMAGYELASVVLQLSDRYVQNHFLGPQSVGLYSAAYNLCDYIRLALFTAMVSAVQPMSVRLNAEGGAAEVSAFLSRFTRMYFGWAFLVIAGVVSVRAELLSILASAKYQPAAAVIPWLLGGMMFEAYFVVAGIGSYLRKRSLTMMSIIGGGALLNVAINLLLVPRFGIVGSGVANVISCGCIVLVARRVSGATVVMPRIAVHLVKFAAVAAAAVWTADQVRLDQAWSTLIARSLVVLVVYGGVVVAVDPVLRATVKQLRAKLPF